MAEKLDSAIALVDPVADIVGASNPELGSAIGSAGSAASAAAAVATLTASAPLAAGAAAVVVAVNVYKSLEQSEQERKDTFTSVATEAYKSIEQDSKEFFTKISDIALQDELQYYASMRETDEERFKKEFPESYAGKKAVLDELEKEIFGPLGKQYNDLMITDLDEQIAFLREFQTPLKEIYSPSPLAGIQPAEKQLTINREIRKYQSKILSELTLGEKTISEAYWFLESSSLWGEAEYRASDAFAQEMKDKQPLFDSIQQALSNDRWFYFGPVQERIFAQSDGKNSELSDPADKLYARFRAGGEEGFQALLAQQEQDIKSYYFKEHGFYYDGDLDYARKQHEKIENLPPLTKEENQSPQNSPLALLSPIFPQLLSLNQTKDAIDQLQSGNFDIQQMMSEFSGKNAKLSGFAEVGNYKPVTIALDLDTIADKLMRKFSAEFSRVQAIS